MAWFNLGLRQNPFQKGAVNTDPNFRGIRGKVMNWNYLSAENQVKAAHAELKTHFETIHSLTENGLEIPKDTQNAFNQAARDFNEAKASLGYAEKKVIPSIQGMFKNMASTVGFDTTNWHSTKVKVGKGGIDELLVKTSETRGGLIERVLSKPFRIAARFPSLPLVGAGLLAVVGIGSAMHKRAEHRTQADVQQQAAMLEAQMQAQQGAQQLPMAQANVVQVPQPVQPHAETQFPAQGSPVNVASPQLQAGNDNVQHQGTVVGQERAAAL